MPCGRTEEPVIEHEDRDNVGTPGGGLVEGGIVGQPQVAAEPEEPPHSSSRSAAMNASWGTSTRPMFFIRFLPSFCFSSSLRLRVMSPP